MLCLDYEPQALPVLQDMQNRLGLQVVPGAHPDLTLWYRCGSPLRAELPSSAQIEWLSAALQMLLFIKPTMDWEENSSSYTLSESNSGGDTCHVNPRGSPQISEMKPLRVVCGIPIQ